MKALSPPVFVPTSCFPAENPRFQAENDRPDLSGRVGKRKSTRILSFGPQRTDFGPRFSNLGHVARPLGQNTLAAKQENRKQRKNRMKPFFLSSDRRPPTSDIGSRAIPSPICVHLRSKSPFSGPSQPQMNANPRKYSIRTSDFGLPTSDFRPRTSDFGLRTSDFRPRTSDLWPRPPPAFRPRISDLGSRTSPPLTPSPSAGSSGRPAGSSPVRADS